MDDLLILGRLAFTRALFLFLLFIVSIPFLFLFIIYAFISDNDTLDIVCRGHRELIMVFTL